MYNIDKIEVSLASEHKSHYTIGGVTVTIIMKNAPFDAEDFSECQCNIYADDFFPMCSSLDAAQSDFEWPTLVYAMQSCRVWLPGKYTLYLRWMNDVLLQVPLTLTKRGHFRLSAMKEEEPLGLADIVTCSLEGKHGGCCLVSNSIKQFVLCLGKKHLCRFVCLVVVTTEFEQVSNLLIESLF